jgi:hypothetical protein
MRNLKNFEHISLDGVIQAPGANEDGDYHTADGRCRFAIPPVEG